jgi:ribonucleoside-diphosphate reductase alpha chain
MTTIGPKNLFSQNLHGEKYRADGETFDDYCVRFSRTTSDGDDHFHRLLGMTREQRFLPAGRQQRAVGTPHQITAFNCFVADTIEDSMSSIMKTLTQGATTMRAGGGKGWDFSTLRPQGDRVNGLGDGAFASGPISFMAMWDAMCTTIMSGGGRRGAMMGVMRVDHPDVRKFIHAKRVPADVQVLWDIVEAMPDSPLRFQAVMALQKTLKLTSFNISLAMTDEFMEAVKVDGLFTLKFDGKSYGEVRALDLWSEIMESNWDWAEPGVLFIDRINKMNPLAYCETIAATNPCAEQPLPPNGACLLASLNLVKYLRPLGVMLANGRPAYSFDYEQFEQDIRDAVRAVDNVIDRTMYPLPEQAAEAKAKRRMGLGYTGIANCIETMGFPYGTSGYIAELEKIHRFYTNTAYRASIELAGEKGSFPLFDADKWLDSGFAKSGVLDDDVLWGIKHTGLRNGLLMSIAPTGTISLCADNVSSGGEPVFALEQRRTVRMAEGTVEVDLNDYAYTEFGTVGRTADEVTPKEHIDVLCAMQKYTDSAVSKTCNVYGQKGGKGPGLTFAEFQGLYMQAYDGGAKGCTTFNSNGKRMGILQAKPVAEEQQNPQETEATGTDGAPKACFFDPATGMKTCE